MQRSLRPPLPRRAGRAIPPLLATALPLLAAACALLALAPSGVQAQGQRPSIRISGGHVYIGGRPAGSIGADRDPHATGRLIRGRLLELGDPRAGRFGPGRRGGPFGAARYPWWIHSRTVYAPEGRPGFGRGRRGFKHADPLWPWPARPFHARPGHFRRGHPGTGFVLILHHPFGAVLVAHRIGWWRWVEITGGAVAGPYLAVPPYPSPAVPPADGSPEGVAPRPPGETPVPRARPAPYEPPPERCADVTVGLLAGAAQRIRVDLATLGAESPREARAALEAQLRFEGRLDLRGARGDGLVAPAALVRSLAVERCPAG